MPRTTAPRFTSRAPAFGRMVFVGAAALAFAACSDSTVEDGNTLELSPAFQTVPVGFSANSNSFDPSGDAGTSFYPENVGTPTGHMEHGSNRGPGGPDDNDHHDGFGRGGLRGLLMGGGLGPDFIGGIPFGHGRGRGPFGSFSLPADCTFAAGTGRVTCPDRTDRGLTISASFAFKDAAGAAQPKFDTLTTDLVNAQVSVSGTRTRRDSSTSTVDHTSDRTVSGLKPGSTARTINGTAKAHEAATGTRDGVAFAATRDLADTTTGLVIPISDGRPTVPSAGKVIRNMTVTITPTGGTAKTRSRREEVTFDGTNTVRVKITIDGTTKNCTITLPGRRLVCE